MQIKLSLRDIIGAKTAPVIQCVNDKLVTIAGSATAVLRISKVAPEKPTITSWMDDSRADVFGDFVTRVEASIIDQVLLSYPGEAVELFETYNSYRDPDNLPNKIETEAVDIFELLPITMKVKFNGDFNQNAIDLSSGDIIVDIKRNEYGKPLPIILQVVKLKGSFLYNNLVSKTAELSLYRGSLTADMEGAIENYIVEYETAYNEALG